MMYRSNSSLFTGSVTSAPPPLQQNIQSSSEPNLSSSVEPGLLCLTCDSSLTQLLEVEISSSDYTSLSSTSSESSDYTEFSGNNADESESSDSPKDRKKFIGKLVLDKSSPITKLQSTPLHDNSVVSICNQESVVIEMDGTPETEEVNSCSTSAASENIIGPDGPYHITKASIMKSRERLNVEPHRAIAPVFSFKCCHCCRCNNQKTFLPFLCLFIFVVIVVFIILIDLLPGAQGKVSSARGDHL